MRPNQTRLLPSFVNQGPASLIRLDNYNCQHLEPLALLNHQTTLPIIPSFFISRSKQPHIPHQPHHGQHIQSALPAHTTIHRSQCPRSHRQGKQIVPPCKSHADAPQIYIVTGSNTGVGREVAQILYSKHATVWIACRNEAKAKAAIDAIRQQHPSSKGRLKFLSLNLSDLSTIASSAETFLSQESRLDVLFNNAGVMMPPPGSKTEQGHDLELGVNCLGPFLFTKLLTPILKKSAESAPKGSVRVVWVSSSAADAMSPSGGVVLDNLDYKVDKNVYHKYGVSKAGNYFHATQFARLYKPDGVISIVSGTATFNMHWQTD